MAFPATSAALQGFSCEFQHLQEPLRHRVECWVSRTNRNIDTLGQGMYSRQTLRDRTRLWTKLEHSPNRKSDSGTFSRCECLPETVDEKEGSFCGALCLDTFPCTSEGTPNAHTSPTTPRFEIRFFNPQLSTIQGQIIILIVVKYLIKMVGSSHLTILGACSPPQGWKPS